MAIDWKKTAFAHWQTTQFRNRLDIHEGVVQVVVTMFFGGAVAGSPKKSRHWVKTSWSPPKNHCLIQCSKKTTQNNVATPNEKKQKQVHIDQVNYKVRLPNHFPYDSGCYPITLSTCAAKTNQGELHSHLRPTSHSIDSRAFKQMMPMDFKKPCTSWEKKIQMANSWVF